MNKGLYVMSSTVIAILTIVVFLAALRWYASAIERQMGVDPTRATPAHRKRDGVDYVPSHPVVLFGHHFASIAGLGPIAGPAIAAIFGFLPGFLWILLGTVFIGAVQDMSALFVSVRHGGISIMSIAGRYMGEGIRKLFLGVMLILLVVVNAVFGVLIALLWIAVTPQAATATWVFVIGAIITGIMLYRLGINVVASTIVGLIFIALGVWLGYMFPIKLGMVEWIVILMVYAYIASILPVWILLQPRDYLNTYLLISGVGGGIIGALVGNFLMQAPLVNAEQAFRFGLDIANRPVWPYVSVLIACGAASGFHSLVSSGTTAKQLPNERYVRHIGYGAMLGEGFLGMTSLMAVTTALAWNEYLDFIGRGAALGAVVTGWGRFLNVVAPFIDVKVLITYAALVATAFGFTTMDSSMRLTRFAIFELFGVRNIYLAGFIGFVLSLIVALAGTAFPLWTLFGSVNQVLVALALTTAAVALAYFGRRIWFLIPGIVYMYATTLFALFHTVAVWLYTLPGGAQKNPLIKAIYTEYTRIYGKEVGTSLADALHMPVFAVIFLLSVVTIVLAIGILIATVRWFSRTRRPAEPQYVDAEGVGPGGATATSQYGRGGGPIDHLADFIGVALRFFKGLLK